MDYGSFQVGFEGLRVSIGNVTEGRTITCFGFEFVGLNAKFILLLMKINPCELSSVDLSTCRRGSDKLKKQIIIQILNHIHRCIIFMLQSACTNSR